MKANEVPEKLYFGESDKGILDIYSTKESDNEVEYIRTDAFIEKAVKWLEKYAHSYTWYNEFEGESGMIEDFTRDFRKAMSV